MNPNDKLTDQLDILINEWSESDLLKEGMSFIVGCSTSEIIGERIGTMGNVDIASLIFSALMNLKEMTGISIVFQCCEHLNRALVMERKLAAQQGYDPVHVVPAKNAGGSMASYAYQHLSDPVVVEHMRADAGIDIGDTMIGMHIKHVAVPLRLKQNKLGQARVNAAYHRPKLIGGERALYK
ncbi:TIGR01440 family protein [Amphibacillus marinus]|uniref:UPF0340 protein SAMN04488134_10582 n=1 Tax=Amphibacillus marinus TaxID=872970 RepID=A0A1H8N0X4_9BACI|nr:TIGR01440 family protein [Amphibacillus marinus]SEO23291.1 TIGR01440 family protein [Amphibacillus marinus]